MSAAPAPRSEGRPLCVALTGGIASGKTAVSDHFARMGVAVIDTDVLAREVVARGSAGLAQVVEAFGPEVLDADGGLDRRAMRARVFADEALRRRLEAIVHPLIRAAVMDRLAGVAAPYVIIVVPLLLESDWDGPRDRVLVVDVPESVQMARLMARDGMDEAAARRMLAAQASRQERLAAADDVMDNSGDLEALRTQVERLHRQYLALAARNNR